MKNFTKLTLILSMLFGILGGVSSVKAEKVTSDFSELASDGATWNSETNTMSWSASWANALKYFMFKDLVASEGYYDLSLYETITFKFTYTTSTTNGVRVRMKDNTGGDGDWILMEDNEDHTHTLNITDFKKSGAALNYSKIAGIQISGGNSTSGASTATFTEISLYYDDPIEKARENLSNLITLAEKQHSFGKTTDSYNALTSQITAAEGVRDNGSATLDDLVTAKADLQDKIDALQLLPGYTNLTLDMYKTWKVEGGNIVEDGAGPGTIKLFQSLNSGDVPYGHMWGDGSWQNFAELSNYTKLYITGTAGESIRGYFSKSPEGTGTIDKTVTFNAQGVVEFDFAEGDGFSSADYIHLIFLKCPSANSGITSLLLYDGKNDLKETVELAGMQNSFAKTDDSFADLEDAISAANVVIDNRTATTAQISEAKTNVLSAISGLKLKAGYAKLTADMFMAHASTAAGAAVTSKTGCAYDVNKASGQPYGDGSVNELYWADLTPYEQFIILTSGEIKPRFCMNRLVKDGQQAATQEDSKMIDINPNNSFTWSTEKYQTIDGSKYIIDLESIVTDYGFARLHCIKGANYGNVTATDFLIYAEYSKAEVGAAGYATFSSIMNVDMTGVNAYSAKYTGGEVVLTPVTEVPANTGVIIEAAAGTYNLTNIESADAIADNELEVSDGTVTGDESTIYVLNKVNDKVGFYLLKSGNKLDAGKAYLRIDGADGARAFIGISGMEETTGISTVKQAEGAKKNEIYNLNGQRVSKPTKGLFIKNGVKFWVD